MEAWNGTSWDDVIEEAKTQNAIETVTLFDGVAVGFVRRELRIPPVVVESVELKSKVSEHFDELAYAGNGEASNLLPNTIRSS